MLQNAHAIILYSQLIQRQRSKKNTVLLHYGHFVWSLKYYAYIDIFYFYDLPWASKKTPSHKKNTYDVANIRKTTTILLWNSGKTNTDKNTDEEYKYDKNDGCLFSFYCIARFADLQMEFFSHQHRDSANYHHRHVPSFCKNVLEKALEPFVENELIRIILEKLYYVNFHFHSWRKIFTFR